MRWLLAMLAVLGCDSKTERPSTAAPSGSETTTAARPASSSDAATADAAVGSSDDRRAQSGPAEASELAEAPIDAAPPPPPPALVLELGETRANGGSLPGIVRAVFRGRRDALFACYESSGSERPRSLAVRLAIGERALATSLRVIRRSGSRAFDRCVTALLRRVSFGLVNGGRVDQTLTVRRARPGEPAPGQRRRRSR